MTTPNQPFGCVRARPRHVAAGTVAMCVLLLLLASNSSAQQSASTEGKKSKEPYALIYGTVYGPNDRPLYGVKVKIRRASEKKARWEHYSDHAGEFAQRVPAGKADYVIWADLKGYKSPQFKSLAAGPEVTVHIENDERTDISLHLKQ